MLLQHQTSLRFCWVGFNPWHPMIPRARVCSAYLDVVPPKINQEINLLTGLNNKAYILNTCHLGFNLEQNLVSTSTNALLKENNFTTLIFSIIMKNGIQHYHALFTLFFRYISAAYPDFHCKWYQIYMKAQSKIFYTNIYNCFYNFKDKSLNSSVNDISEYGCFQEQISTGN